MSDGSCLVIRPIQLAVEHWDTMKLGFQEQTVGRHKHSGTPIGKQHEFDALDLDAVDKNGKPLIAENSHARLAALQSNDGAQILRRAYAYDNGVASERWPLWRQAVTRDAGLLFQCSQRDPRSGSTKMFEKMSRFDMLNQATTHVGSVLFACPPGPMPGSSSVAVISRRTRHHRRCRADRCGDVQADASQNRGGGTRQPIPTAARAQFRPPNSRRSLSSAAAV